MNGESLSQTPADILACPTPQAWLDRALDDVPALLLDHANCEKKAASTALALMFRYPQHAQLCHKMSRLAREELRHFEQVDKLIRSRSIAFRRVAPTRYAAGLRAEVRSDEPGRLIDTLICGAFIEARSCERFGALAPRLDASLRRFYEGLLASESRHFRDYLTLADDLADGAIDDRVSLFGDVESRLILAPDPVFGFHSGVPDEARAQSRALTSSV